MADEESEGTRVILVFIRDEHFIADTKEIIEK